ncbi:MAG TPA: hypothetical protein ENJ90_05350 [Devosia sp.]|nr:hypothetical protein [Devosia sp.]
MGNALDQPISYNDISPKLINELALGLYPPSEVFERFGYSKEQAARLIDSGAFAKALKDAKAKWASTESAEERIRLKALIALEEMMPSLFAMGVDFDVNPTARNEVFKSFQRLAGIEKQEQGSVGAGFAININLGDTKHEIVVDKQPVIESSDT